MAPRAGQLRRGCPCGRAEWPFFASIRYGQAAVVSFFVLSGYVTALLLATAGAPLLKSFYSERLLRLLPLYFAANLFALAVFPFLTTGEFNSCEGNITSVIYHALVIPMN